MHALVCNIFVMFLLLFFDYFCLLSNHLFFKLAMRQNFETNIVLSSILFIFLFSSVKSVPIKEKKNNLWFW